jgi:phosphatidylserine decarboxylase
MFYFLSNNLLWTQGQRVVLWLIVQTMLLIFVSYINLIPSSLTLIIAAIIISELLFSLYFFRNPERLKYDQDQSTAIISPADGTIVDITHVLDTDMVDGYYTQKISIFLSPLDVHVQWTPTEGTVTDIVYKKGLFMFAFLPKSSQYNERNDVYIKNSCGALLVRQIAGTVARRIVVWVNKADKVYKGQKYGMIKFGSRVDIYLPSTVQLQVRTGQRVQGGLTQLGTWSC